MYEYNVDFSYCGEILSDFKISANNLRQAKAYAQSNKGLYCTCDKPTGIPANRIRVTVRRAFNK